MNNRALALLAVLCLLLGIVTFASGSTMLAVAGGRRQIARVVSEEDYDIVQRYRRLEEVRRTLEEEYYQPLDEDALITGAIRGMMRAVDDPYTFYYTPEEMQASNEQSEGAYRGVGMVVQIDGSGYIEIVRVYPGTPAEAAGIQTGDYLVRVNGRPVSGENAQKLEEAVSLIQGGDEDEVELTVLRKGSELTVMAVPAQLTVSYVDYQILSGDIGYINISQFTGNDVAGFEAAKSAFESAGVSGVVLDLRDNPGGMLDHVVAIADMLLPEGLVTYVEDKYGNRQEERSDARFWDIPLVVLVNGNSASASELITAAIQDHERGVVVGTTTYGKGIVQTLITFAEDGAGMQYTTSSYFSPEGRSIHKTGVEPDVVVELAEDAFVSALTPDPARDNQLAAALRELEKIIAR